MKIEARGKYAGVKVHLDGDEAKMFLNLIAMKGEEQKKFILPVEDPIIKFAFKLGKKIDHLLEEMPNLLEERTEEQIKEALEGDQEKITNQLKALEKGKDWKKV